MGLSPAKKRTLIAVSLFAIAGAASSVVAGTLHYRAGFDCTKAKTGIEKTICRTKELADDDRELTAMYRQLLINLPADEKNTLRHEQRSWIRQRESSCGRSATMAVCLKDSYARRIKTLKIRYPQNGNQKPSREDILYRRLLSSDKAIHGRAMHELDGLDRASKEVLSKKLVEALKSGDEASQRRAAHALSGIGAPAVPFVLEAYRSQEHDVRLLVMNILGAIGPATSEVLPAILNGAEDENNIVRLASIDALGKMKSASPEILDALIKATGDRDLTVRSRACIVLGDIGPRAVHAVPAIVNVLEYHESDTRNQIEISLMHQQAAVALGKIGIGSDLTLPSLLTALKSNDDLVRFAAGRALVQIGPPAIPSLFIALKDPDLSTRTAAIRAIGEIGPTTPEAEKELIGALQDDSFAVRSGAAYALRKIKTESARAAVTKYEEEERVRTEQAKLKREKNLHRQYTKGEIVSDIPADADHKYPLELVYGFGIRSYNQNELYVTLHRGRDRADLLRIWLRINDLFALVKEMKADEEGQSHFGRVSSIWYEVKKNDREQFIHIPLLYAGTGGGRDDTIYCVLPDMTLQPVTFKPATAWYKSKLRKGEAIWKGEQFDFSSDRLGFEFYIWNEKDANCCPTAGKVVGTYKIEGSRKYDFKLKREVAHFTVVVDTYKRLPIER